MVHIKPPECGVFIPGAGCEHLLVSSCLLAGVAFTKHPANQTVSQGNAARLGCAVRGLTEPDIVWMKDGEKLYSTDQMFITLGEQHWETYHRSTRRPQRETIRHVFHVVPSCLLSPEVKLLQISGPLLIVSAARLSHRR